MIFIQWCLCWTCFYIGDLASKILNLYDVSDRWIYFWYPIYSKCMNWSSRLQDAAGYNPHKVDDVSEWVWCKAKDNTGEN